jgi:hypothetical protein
MKELIEIRHSFGVSNSTEKKYRESRGEAGDDKQKLMDFITGSEFANFLSLERPCRNLQKSRCHPERM